MIKSSWKRIFYIDLIHPDDYEEYLVNRRAIKSEPSFHLPHLK
jgi:hypothetical protein